MKTITLFASFTAIDLGIYIATKHLTPNKPEVSFIFLCLSILLSLIVLVLCIKAYIRETKEIERMWAVLNQTNEDLENS